jgi:hypothetical protein
MPGSTARPIGTRCSPGLLRIPLRTALKGQDEGLEDLAMAVGQRRQRQGISLTGLLRAYRLWAKDTLGFLQEETPQLLVEVAPEWPKS